MDLKAEAAGNDGRIPCEARKGETPCGSGGLWAHPSQSS